MSIIHAVVWMITHADINECMRELDQCHGNATCTNTFGGYNCSCDDGFTGDGFNCTGIHVALTLQILAETVACMC